MAELLSRNITLFTGESLREAFKGHPIKLEFIEFSLSFIEESTVETASMGAASPQPMPAMIEVTRRVMRVAPFRRQMVKPIERLVRELREKGVTTLDKVAKESGFYANLSRGGTSVVPAEISPAFLKTLWQGSRVFNAYIFGFLVRERIRERPLGRLGMLSYYWTAGR